MEFIPLEKYNKKTVKKAQKREIKKVISAEKSEDQKPGVKKEKRKRQVSVTEKKNKVETSPIKKKKISQKGFLKRKTKELKEEEEDDVESVENSYNENDEEEEEEDEEDTVDTNQIEDNEREKNSEEDYFKKKCEKLDEKMKNRLFLKLKKKIHCETEVKELHPDIRKIIFPRKKNSRWCWIVFASEEKADEALKKLIKNKDIFVNKPNSYERVTLKRKKKMKTVLRKKEARRKLQKMWM